MALVFEPWSIVYDMCDSGTMSIGYTMTQGYGHTAVMGPTANPEAFYSSYYSHPNSPGGPHQALYQGWGYNTGYTTGYSAADVMTSCGTDFGVSGGFVMGPGSPRDLGGDYTIEMVDGCGRIVKRRTSANKKERRRTQSINNAFAELRDCIPNVPADTKLSKIKTLRLATSYIAHLMDILHNDENSTLAPEHFKAELPPKMQKLSPEAEKVRILKFFLSSIIFLLFCVCQTI